MLMRRKPQKQGYYRKTFQQGESFFMIYNFTRFNATNEGKWTEGIMPPHASFHPCSEIAVCLENGLSGKLSDRINPLFGEWRVSRADEGVTEYDTDANETVAARVPDLKPASALFEEENSENKCYIYSREFEVYDESDRNFITFERVGGYFEVYVNGNYIGASGLGYGEFEISEAAVKGKNTLLVRISKNINTPKLNPYADGEEGIYGNVYLTLRKDAFLYDYRFSGARDGLNLEGTLTLYAEGNEGIKANVVIADGEEIIAEEESVFEDGKAEIKISGEYKTYNAETPELYDVYIRIIDGETEKECTKINVGFSLIATEGDNFISDGTPIKLKGTVYYPEAGADYRDELGIMKSFNMNAVWVSGYVKEEFYDIASEIGIYVIREIPFTREEKDEKNVNKHTLVENAEEYMSLTAMFEVAGTESRPCVIGYSFGEMSDEREGAGKLVELYEATGKPVAGINFGIAPAKEGLRPMTAFVPASKVLPDETEKLLTNLTCAGVFIEAFKTEDKENSLFDENNVEKESAEIMKFVYRPYSSYMANNRTLFIRNNNSFIGSENLEVIISSVKGQEERVIQKIKPVIAPLQTREYGIYLGEYDEHTKIHIRYEENGTVLATETITPKSEEISGEFIDSLKAKKYEYTVVNREFTLGKTEENVIKARSFFIPCSSETVCNNATGISDRVYNLSGEWDFAYYEENAPVTFGGEGTVWNKINLPASWESAGYEKFSYAYGYPFKANLTKFTINDKDGNKNSVGIYRRFINVDDTEFRYILSFGKVNGSIELQVNGKYVGFSMLKSAEFDISEYVTLGENEVVVIVKKWTPTSFLYGTDGFNASGIIGNVKLIKYRESGLFDYDFKTKKMGKEYAVTLKLKFFTDKDVACKIELRKGEKTIYQKICQSDNGEITVEFQGKFEPYNTETHQLYDLYVKAVERNFVTECTKIRVGFRETGIMGDVVYYNDEPLKLRGIVYNAIYNEYGELVNAENVKRDFGLMKEYGFNAVRAIYGVTPEFCALAGEAGLYVIGDSGINTEAAAEKGAKFRDAVIGNEEFLPIIEKTIINNYIKYKNACNVPMYLIAENGESAAIAQVITELKKIAEIPVFCYGNGAGDGITADFPAVNDVVDLINVAADKKPILFARYGNAAGIGCATMNEYEELISDSECCVGGFVANFTDDIIKGEGKKACGIFTADRMPYPGAESIKYLYRPLRSEVVNEAEKVAITNTMNYLSTADIAVKLKVLQNGKPLSETRLEIDVPPKECKEYDIFVGHIEKDMFLNVEYFSKITGKRLYVEQHTLNNELKAVELNKGVNPLICTELFDYLDIEFDCGSVRFNKRLGSIVRYTLKGKELLKAESVRMGGNCFINNIRRPFVRNMKKSVPVVKSSVKRFECNYKNSEDTSKVTVSIDNMLTLDGKDSYIVQDKYVVNSNGAIEVFSILMPLRRDLPVMDCFGKQIRFCNAFGNVIYYGNGDGDNYIDMCEHTRVGIFGLNVDKTFEKIGVLQECGNRTNVRYAIIRDNDGDGAVIAARRIPFQLRVSPYSDKEIKEGFFTGEKPVQSGVYVDINAFVSGIGASENGYPMPQYIVRSSEHVLHFDFIPVSACKQKE